MKIARLFAAAGLLLLAFTQSALAAELFPPNCAALPLGWGTPAGATTGWSIATDYSTEGTCSLKSNPMADSAGEGLFNTAQVQFSGQFTDGLIRFDYKLSTEEGYDCLRFFIDGAAQGFATSCTYNHGGVGGSGLTEWATALVPISAGVHTITWSYEKDYSDSQGVDAVWIDNVSLPLAAPVITSAAPPGGTVGTAYTHTYTASGIPAPTFALTGGTLPTGLALNATTGVLSGTPTASGTFLGTVSAVNSGGNGNQAFAITIAPTVPGAPAISSATPGNGLAVIAFAPPASDGGAAITSYRATCNPGAFTASGSASPITVTGLANGTTYGCSVTATNSAGTGPASGSVNVAPSAAAGLALVQVQSRKTHGAAGTFDLALDTTQPIGGSVTVEPRSNAAGHKLVFQFNATITAAGTVTCVDALAAAVGSCSAVAAGSSVEVTMTGIPDAKRVTVTLAGVNGGGASFAVSAGFLLGDVDSTRATTAADILAVKGRSAQAVTSANFLYDLNLTGGVTATDILAVKSRSGQAL